MALSFFPEHTRAEVKGRAISLGTDGALEGRQALKSSILGFRSQLTAVTYSALTVTFVRKDDERSLEGLLERLNR